MIFILTFILIFYGDVPRAPSYVVYISQIILFATVSSHLADFNASKKNL